VAGRRRAVLQGEARGRASVELVSRELDEAIRNLGLTYAAVARDVGLSPSQVGRIARAMSPELSIVQASTLLAAVGLELSTRAFPGGRPLRDTPQLNLLARFRPLLHQRLGWASEVPVTQGPDLRAWDGMVMGEDWRYGAEAETRIRDWQALERRITLKVRDSHADGVLLLVWKTRSNLTTLRSLGSAVSVMFPVPGDAALTNLAAGRNPGGSALILV
jgi:hypothetical protein